MDPLDSAYRRRKTWQKNISLVLFVSLSNIIRFARQQINPNRYFGGIKTIPLNAPTAIFTKHQVKTASPDCLGIYRLTPSVMRR